MCRLGFGLLTMSKVGRAMPTIYLLRHAESQPDRTIPEPDWPLSERGRQQALDLVPTLGRLGITAVYSSPFPRAVDTVRPFAVDAGLVVNLHHDLRERKLLDGRVPDYRALLRQTWQDFEFAAPGGESNSACQRRVVAAVHDIISKHSEYTLLLVSHGNAIAIFLNSIDRSFGYEGWAAMKNPDLFKIEATDGGFVWNRSWQSGLG